MAFIYQSISLSRHIMKIQLIAPDNEYLATINNTGVLCIYEVQTGKLV